MHAGTELPGGLAEDAPVAVIGEEQAVSGIEQAEAVRQAVQGSHDPGAEPPVPAEPVGTGDDDRLPLAPWQPRRNPVRSRHDGEPPSGARPSPSPAHGRTPRRRLLLRGHRMGFLSPTLTRLCFAQGSSVIGAAASIAARIPAGLGEVRSKENPAARHRGAGVVSIGAPPPLGAAATVGVCSLKGRRGRRDARRGRCRWSGPCRPRLPPGGDPGRSPRRRRPPPPP